VTEVDAAELGHRQLIDSHLPAGDPHEVGVVGDHGEPILARVHVGLDVARADGHRAREREQRVLGRIHREPPMCEHTGAGGGEVALESLTWRAASCQGSQR
jgi:hypothetical protein